MRQAFKALIAEIESIQSHPRHGPIQLTEDQCAYIRLARERGVGWHAISTRGRKVWPLFPGKDWLRERKHEWGVE